MADLFPVIIIGPKHAIKQHLHWTSEWPAEKSDRRIFSTVSFSYIGTSRISTGLKFSTSRRKLKCAEEMAPPVTFVTKFTQKTF